MKKRKALIFSVSILLLCAMLLNLSGCAGTVKAQDLMEGIESASVTGKTPDETFISSQMELALKLFKSSSAEDKNKNVLISPISVQLALAMTANGASGNTKDEMEALLGTGITLEELNEYLYTYIESLPSKEKYKLDIANSIWIKDADSLSVESDFLQTNANYYRAQAYKSAFDKQTVKDINNWVDIHTDGMIDKLIYEIDGRAVMYLINALAFDAEWESVYERSDIRDGEFTSVTGEKQSVKMMKSTEGRYIETENAVGFMKSYKDSKYSFVALLPNEDVALDSYISNLNSEELLNALESVRYVTVNATMPKFEYEYTLEMKDCLKKLGMNDAFDATAADFSRLGSSDEGNIYIDDVLHKTFICVDERGTKAGAVTKIEMNDAGSASPEDTVYVTLDRPFVYMIVDTSTNLPIFIGALTSVK